MAWNTSDIPDLTGSVAVVTGANTGLGLETARALAGAGARVVIAARNLDKAEAGRGEILVSHPTADLDLVPLDLASLASVEEAARIIDARYSAVDILVNNAGVMAIPEGRTEDGFEMQFGVNHLGHWVLTARLLAALLTARAARVVSVTSTAHHYAHPVDPDNPNLEGDYDPWTAYGQSKLANYHFALGLDREFEARRLAAESLITHPGLTDTNLQTRAMERGSGGLVGRLSLWFARHTGMDPAHGALPLLRAATDPAARGGQMYAPRFVNNGPPVRRPILRRVGLDGAIADLWAVSEDLTGVRFDFPAAIREANRRITAADRG